MKSINPDYPDLDVQNAQITASDITLRHDGKELIWSLTFKTADKDVKLSLQLGHEDREYPYRFISVDNCAEAIKEILSIAGVRSFSDLVGQNVRIGMRGDKVRAIGHIIDQNWTYPFVITCQD